MTNIVFLTGRYQLGNDPGVFQDALYVGHDLSLPFTWSWIDPDAKSVGLLFYTHDVETWSDWQGHHVSINDVEVGRLKDPSDKQGVNEVFRIDVPIGVLTAALKGKKTFRLTVAVGEQAGSEQFIDDFVLWRIESDGTFAAHLGWK